MAKHAEKSTKRRVPRNTATPELTQRALALVAGGMSLRKAAQTCGIGLTTALDAIERHGLSEQYTRARETRADVLAEECIEIVDDKSGDPARDRLRLDARKWFASKLHPRKYSDRIEHSGPAGGPIQTEDVGARELLAAKLAALKRD